MRPLLAVALALLVVLSGCAVGYQQPDRSGTAGQDELDSGTAGGVTEADDPETDRIGWEGGYAYDDPIPVTVDDGLDEAELEAIVMRAMARVEHIRQLEFSEPIPVEVINRTEYQQAQSGGGGGDRDPAFVSFDRTKFEAMFLVGEDRDALSVQSSNRGSNVGGFYSPSEDRIVIVSGDDQPQLSDELTLAHELTHALQDQQFDLTAVERPTRERYNAYNGLVEGDASYIQRTYAERCGADWDCVQRPQSGGGGGGGDIHLGIYLLNYFPYTDGPGFIEYHQSRSGWAGVDEIYAAPPTSTAQIVDPASYDTAQPAELRLPDTNQPPYERVIPPSAREGSRADYAALGQSGMASMFGYTLYDDFNGASVVARDEVLNYVDGELDQQDPLNYDFDYVSGLEADRLHVYDRDFADDESAYVWRSRWDSPASAEEFATGYRALLSHWGGSQAGSPAHWRISDGPFADAFYIEVEGDTVTIVNAPRQDALPAVYADYRPVADGS